MKKELKKEQDPKDDPRDIIFLLTDGCMWEMNKQNKRKGTHSIEVVNEKTGQVRFIKSGSRIRFLTGDITNSHNQEDYNKKGL